jgi:hypothetical protein
MPVEAANAFALLLAQEGLNPNLRKNAEYSLALAKATIGRLRIRGLPPDVEVRLDGAVVPAATLAHDFAIAAGDHAIQVTGDKYKSFATKVTVAAQTPKPTDLDVQLEKSDVQVSVRWEASVAPAQVSLDGAPPEPLPLESTLKPGLHSYVVTSEGYRLRSGTVELEPGSRVLVQSALVPTRAPIGLRFEPFFGATMLLRDDTPLNNGVTDGDYANGSPFALMGGVHLFYDAARWRALALGLSFEYVDRPLNKGAFGVITEFCPDLLTWDDHSGVWCPATAIFQINAIAGRVNRFSGGERAMRLGTKLERHFGQFYFAFSGGLGWDMYKRTIVDLGVLSTHLATAVGMDL